MKDCVHCVFAYNDDKGCFCRHAGVERYIDKPLITFCDHFWERRRNMTDIGYNFIIKKIREQYVEMPANVDMTFEELRGWMNGYAVCRDTIISMLEQMAKGQRD